KTGTSTWTLSGTRTTALTLTADAGGLNVTGNASGLDLSLTGVVANITGTIHNTTASGGSFTVGLGGHANDLTTTSALPVVINGTLHDANTAGGIFTIGGQGSVNDLIASAATTLTIDGQLRDATLPTGT